MEKRVDDLMMAYRIFESGAELRCRRVRNKNFTYGRQWGEMVADPDGNRVTEGELASRSGKQPLTHNLVRQLVKSVVGRWRYDNKKSRRVDDVAETIRRRNQLDELDSRALEEFLISGCAIQRVVKEKRLDGEGVWVDNVSPARFFVNRYDDPRGGDIELIGMLQDMSLKEVIMRWGKGEKGRMEEIERIYRRYWSDGDYGANGVPDEPDFFNAGAGRCRVIEVWTLESRGVLYCHDSNSGRMFMTEVGDTKRIAEINRKRSGESRGLIETRERQTLRWHCRYFAPSGEVLGEMDSPWGHSMHPFVVKMYPLTDGEVHSLVEDVIDQQRYINRLVTLVDHVMSFSAKGVLMFPVEALPAGFNWDDVRSQWARPDGIVPYLGTFGSKPEQVVGNGSDAGASNLLALEMKMMEQVSGVTNALQGQLPQAITSAEALRSSIENATVSLLDLFESFESFRSIRNSRIKDID